MSRKEDSLIKNVWEPVFWQVNFKTGEALLDVRASDNLKQSIKAFLSLTPVRKGSQAPDQLSEKRGLHGGDRWNAEVIILAIM